MINLVSVKCYLSLEDQLRSLLPLLPSPTSSPGTPGILHFPDCDSICVEFLQLPALGRGPVSSLLFLLLQGLQGTLQPPEHSLAKTWGVGLLLGHETTSFLKTQHNPCFPYGAVILFAFLVCLDEKLFLTDSAIRFLSISIYRQSSEEGIHRAWTPS